MTRSEIAELVMYGVATVSIAVGCIYTLILFLQFLYSF